MSFVKHSIIAKLPNPESDGLSKVAARFVDNPHRTILTVSIMSAKSLEYPAGPSEDGTTAVNVKLRHEHIEVIDADDEDYGLVLEALKRAHSARTGEDQIPGLAASMTPGIRVGGAAVDPATGAFEPEVQE